MISKEKAVEIATAYINEQFTDAGQLVVADDSVIEKDYGWVMFYNTAAFFETGEIRHALAGNGPLIVEKADGIVVALGTAKPVEQTIEEYERSRCRIRKDPTSGQQS